MAKQCEDRVSRRIAIAVPARNEAERIAACLEHIDGLDLDDRVASLHVLVIANNCVDATVSIARRFKPEGPMSLRVEERWLNTAMANAGWARRLAFDTAVEELRDPTDVLLGTDADTRVGRDWLLKTLDHLDDGYDAVAGLARLDPRELRTLSKEQRRRLSSIRSYLDAVDYLKGRDAEDEPWPRHFYEGGASMALTLGAYERIGGAPTPPVGEDKALFDRLRAVGCRIRHPKDVRTLTSCRLDGRAPGGAADTLAMWALQDQDAPLAGLESLDGLRSPLTTAGTIPTLATLAGETVKARRLIRERRAARGGALASARDEAPETSRLERA